MYRSNHGSRHQKDYINRGIKLNIYNVEWVRCKDKPVDDVVINDEHDTLDLDDFKQKNKKTRIPLSLGAHDSLIINKQNQTEVRGKDDKEREKMWQPR